MTERTPKPPEEPEVREARGAAREVIGKLLGDDQAVRDGRSEQRKAGADTDTDTGTGTDAAGSKSSLRPTKTSKTEQE